MFAKSRLTGLRALATIGIALVLAGCSSSGQSPSPSSAAPATAAAPTAAPASVAPASVAASPVASASGGLAAAQALVDMWSQVQPFSGPTDPIAASSLKGKTVWVIVNSFSNPFNMTIAQAATAALAKAGVGTKLIDGKGQLNEWTRQIELAVSQKVDAIIDSGLPTDQLSGPMKDVAAANIPLVEAVNDVNAVPEAGVTARVVLDYQLEGQIMAAYIIAQSQGKASVLLYNDPEFPNEVGNVAKGATQYFAANCPACKVITKIEQIATVATSVPADTQSILRANPDIKWVISNFDYLGGFVVQGLQQGGFTDVKVVGGDAVAQQLDQVRKGDFYVADVGATPIWCGWAAADTVMRAMLGKNPSNAVIPYRLLTTANIAATDDPSALFGTDVQTPYLKLWGVTP
ncbi:MAG: sugar ABC transporter substrate-binding protein [Candidatus Limnocylindrales bacterium]